MTPRGPSHRGVILHLPLRVALLACSCVSAMLVPTTPHGLCVFLTEIGTAMPHPGMSWHNLYPTTPASTWIAEAPASWHRTISEKLVRCLWFDQRWRPSPLRTLDGRELLVHSPGRWNLQAGPDFHQASIEDR